MEMTMARAVDRRQEKGEDRRHGRDGAPSGDGADSGGRGGSAPSRARLTGPQAVALAQEQLEMMINRPCESVSKLSRTPDGWVIVLEVVELERVPQTTDIMASYRVELNGDGDLMGYERTSRYYRNQACE
jgi:hypothetical protein